MRRFVLHTLILFSPMAVAAPADDLLLQEALLRQYTTAEAEQRYNERKANPQAATDALGTGLSNLASRMYQRSRERVESASDRIETRERFKKAVLNDWDIVINSAEERRMLIELLEEMSNIEYWQATKRLVEYALWLRPGAQDVFPEPQEKAAAKLLRDKIHGRFTEGWAKNTLAKLYLVGRGVPRDETKARHLFESCANYTFANYSDTKVEDRVEIEARCGFNLARLHEKGWGVDVDPKKAEQIRNEAVTKYNKEKKTQLSAVQIEELIRP